MAIDVNWSSNTAWYADVILPETHFWREATRSRSAKASSRFWPQKQVVEPVLDTRPAWRIFKELAERLGFGDKFFYKDIDDYNQWKLSDTGIDLTAFDERAWSTWRRTRSTTTENRPEVQDAIQEDRDHIVKNGRKRP